MPPFIPSEIGRLATAGFGTELIYSFVIIVCSMMIYAGTREIYELSSYRGLKYFRQAFLFFAVAYFFRSFIKFIIMYFNIGIREFSPMLVGNLALMVFMYFSSLAIFYLLYSVMWKKWNGSSGRIWLFHGLALIISFLSVVSRNQIILLAVNIVLLAIVAFVVFTSHQNVKKKGKGRNLHIIYMLLSVFFLLNTIDILVPNFFQTFQMIIYLASMLLFLIMLYKVLRKSGSD